MAGTELVAGRRILFLNWRDLTNPAAGGAETYAEEIARRFVRAGATVTLFTSAYRDSVPYDWSNGYLVLREGGRFGVYFAARRHLKRYGHHYDAIVDFQNGIPFFAPLWTGSGKAVVCVVHHVHQAQFDLYFPWPLNRVARMLEGRVSRAVYRRRPLVAVSPSTRAEMCRQLRFREQIHIVPNGIRPLGQGGTGRSATPAIAVVTRIVPHKRLHLLVAAVPELLARWPELRVCIAGDGPALPALRAQVRELGLEAAVSLPGRVSEQAKADLLSQAWLTVAPSLNEGWGLTVIEASSAGTPAVAFDVPGLRDSVRDQITGWLAPADQSLATALAAALTELSDPHRQRVIAGQCRRWADKFSWDASADRLANVVSSELTRVAEGRPAQRNPVQLSTVAWWPTEEASDVEPLLRKSLRLTDVITSSEDGIRAMLVGCDELGAARALERLPVPPRRLRLATTTEVLCGISEDDLK
jgi:glycosyltransferase involved in cell wall biosynthesis